MLRYTRAVRGLKKISIQSESHHQLHLRSTKRWVHNVSDKQLNKYRDSLQRFDSRAYMVSNAVYRSTPLSDISIKTLVKTSDLSVRSLIVPVSWGHVMGFHLPVYHKISVLKSRPLAGCHNLQ